MVPPEDPSDPRSPTDWDHYAHFDPTNPAVRRLFLDVMYRGYRELLAHTQFHEPISILELGSGTGYVTRRIAEAVPTRRVTLVDANRKMLEMARETLASLPVEAEFVHADFFALQLDGEYDLVHSAGVVEHFEDRRRLDLLALHAAFARRGGYCIVYAPTPSSAYHLWRRLFERLNLWPFHDEVPLPQSQLVDELEATGLRVVAVNRFWDYFLTEVGLLARRPEDGEMGREGEL